MKKAEVKKGKKKNALKEYWPLYLMMLPALLYLQINNYIQMAGMVIAFKKLNFAKGIWASPWAGLKNFKFLFASKDAWIITRNTLLYNIAFILVNMVVGIAIAILITEIRNTKLKKIYQSAILLPFLMEGVYLQLTGPQYESPQEIAMCRTLGADAVGMSTACEAIAARHMGMRVIGISCITNLAAGISPQPLCHAEVQEAADMVAPQFKKLVAATIQGIAKTL